MKEYADERTIRGEFAELLGILQSPKTASITEYKTPFEAKKKGLRTERNKGEKAAILDTQLTPAKVSFRLDHGGSL